MCATVGMTGPSWLADWLAELRNTHMVGFACAHVYSPMSFFLLYVLEGPLSSDQEEMTPPPCRIINRIPGTPVVRQNS